MIGGAYTLPCPESGSTPSECTAAITRATSGSDFVPSEGFVTLGTSANCDANAAIFLIGPILPPLACTLQCQSVVNG